MPQAAQQLRVVKPVVREDTALFIPVGMTYEDWEREAKAVQCQHRAMMWHLGDVMNFGQEHFGELFAQAVETYCEDSIQRAMRVCRAFPPQRRRPIGFSFHQSIVPWTERDQDQILDEAVRGEWTREVFREEVKRRNDERRKLDAVHDASAPPEGPLERAEEAVVEVEAERVESSAEVVMLFPQAEAVAEAIESEPAPILTAAEAAALLLAMPHSTFPARAWEAIRTVLTERERLLELLEAAEEAIQLYALPTLDDAVKAARA